MNCKICGKELSTEKEICTMCDIKSRDPNASKIENYEGLVRRADKMIKEFSKYPAIPSGNLSIDFIEDVFNFNPLFVLDTLKKSVADMLLEKTDFRYSQKELSHIVEETYKRHEENQKNRILNTIMENWKAFVDTINFFQHSYMSLRPLETQIFYYAYSIYYISKDLEFGEGLLYAKKVLEAISLFQCQKDSTPFDGIDHSGKLLSLKEFAKDKQVYDKMMAMIEAEINQCDDETVKTKLTEEKSKKEKIDKKGKILCLISLVLSIIGLFIYNPYYLISLISLILAIIGFKKNKSAGTSKFLGICCIILAILTLILPTIIVNINPDFYYNLYN